MVSHALCCVDIRDGGRGQGSQARSAESRGFHFVRGPRRHALPRQQPAAGALKAGVKTGCNCPFDCRAGGQLATSRMGRPSWHPTVRPGSRSRLRREVRRSGRRGGRQEAQIPCRTSPWDPASKHASEGWFQWPRRPPGSWPGGRVASRLKPTSKQGLEAGLQAASPAAKPGPGTGPGVGPGGRRRPGTEGGRWPGYHNSVTPNKKRTCVWRLPAKLQDTGPWRLGESFGRSACAPRASVNAVQAMENVRLCKEIGSVSGSLLRLVSDDAIPEPDPSSRASGRPRKASRCSRRFVAIWPTATLS